MPGRGLGLIGLLGGGVQSQGQGKARVEHEKGSIGFSPKLADQLNEVSQFAYCAGPGIPRWGGHLGPWCGVAVAVKLHPLVVT